MSLHDVDALVDLATTHSDKWGDSCHHALGAEVVRLRATLAAEKGRNREIRKHYAKRVKNFACKWSEQLGNTELFGRLRREAEERLPEGMKNCTIEFKQCPIGHGWLTAKNWVQHDCPTYRYEVAERRSRGSEVHAAKVFELFQERGRQVLKLRSRVFALIEERDAAYHLFEKMERASESEFDETRILDKIRTWIDAGLRAKREAQAAP